MHAALISLVLMSGACGDMMEPPREEVTISLPAESFHARCGCYCPNPNPAAPPLYRCCPDHAPSMPACNDGYKPACYFYPNHRLLFHPAHYTLPYDYRNEFDYPWDDMRVPCAVPPIGF